MLKRIPSIGHPLIDAEHEDLIKYAGMCTLTCPNLHARHDCNGCQNGTTETCKDRFHNILDHLLPSVQKHFDDEEAVMGQADVDNKNAQHFAVHINAHQHLLSGLRIQATMLAANSEGASTITLLNRLHDYIVDHLIDHVYRYDTKLIPLLTKAGLAEKMR